MLASRLERLVDEGILEKRAYSERPLRYEYFLTEKGLDLWPVLVALMGFGDKHSLPPGAEPPMRIVHKECGGIVNDRRICESLRRRARRPRRPRRPGRAPRPAAGPA